MLVLTNMWPTPERPWYGTFTAVQMRSVERAGLDVRVQFVDGSKSRWAYLVAALRLLAANVTGLDVDVVHAHTGYCGALACLQRRHPVIVSYAGSDLNGVVAESGRLTLKSRLERTVFRRLPLLGAATITKSRRLEDQLPRRARTRNVVLPNGVDRTLFAPIPREAARSELGWPAYEVTALFAADPRLAGKRFELAESAVRIAAERVRGLRLRVVSGVEHEQVAVAMNAADVLVFASRAEGSPNVVKEALACDLPVVATDVGDVPEILEGVSRSEVVPVDVEPAGMAEALVRVLADAPARSDGRDRTAHLDADAVAARLIDVYRAVVAGRSPVGARAEAQTGS